MRNRTLQAFASITFAGFFIGACTFIGGLTEDRHLAASDGGTIDGGSNASGGVNGSGGASGSSGSSGRGGAAGTAGAGGAGATGSGGASGGGAGGSSGNPGTGGALPDGSVGDPPDGSPADSGPPLPTCEDGALAERYCQDGDTDGYCTAECAWQCGPAAGDGGDAGPLLVLESTCAGPIDCDDGDSAIHPGIAELCNGVDDNCLGGIDDGVEGSDSTCGAVQGSLGECAGMTLTCTSGAWVGTCTGSPTELCNDDGKDDDCDGQVNEGCECLNGATSSCGVARGYRGDCASRPMTCAGGTWTGACSPTSSEQCNNDGRDEDCDGNPRNGCPCLTGETASCGECGGAITTCSNGVWGSCVTQVSQNRPCGPCGFDLQWCGSSGSWDGCGGNTYAGYYCADGDGDRWCTSCGYHCSQPQYWRPQSECYGSECNDGNSCRTECPGEWVPGGYYEWGKPWRGFGNCEDHYYGGDCPCGTALAACDIWQISGGGNVTDLGGCWARICEDGGTESAAAAWQAWCYVQ